MKRPAYHYISHLSQLPATTHYVALQETSIHIPGDERSRTNPGHGYPESTEHHLSYIAFDSRADMEAWVSEQEAAKWGKRDYRIIEVKPLAVKVTATVQVGAAN